MTKPKRSSSEIGRANLAKSKAMERLLVAYLRANGWPGAERTVRTGYAVAGRTSADQGDIDGTPGLVWQAKNVGDTRLHRVPTWLAETAAQRDAAGADYGVLVVKRAGHAHPGQWWAYVELGALVVLTGGRLGLFSVAPVRLEVAELVPLLHLAGYGSYGDSCPAQASGEAQDCTCADPAACGDRYGRRSTVQEAS